MLTNPTPDRADDKAIFCAFAAAREATDALLLAGYAEHHVTRDMRLTDAVEHLRTVAAELEAVGYPLAKPDAALGQIGRVNKFCAQREEA
jgi:hypothetical protein